MNWKTMRLLMAGTVIICLFIQPGLDLIAQERPTPHAQNVEIVGQFGGVSRAVVVQGEYAYLGVGPRVIILNIGDPVHPTYIGQTPVFQGIVNDLEIVGNTIYVATSAGGVHIVDLSNLANPEEISAYYISGFASGLSISGNKLYVMARETGLHIVDISKVTEPVLIQLLELPESVIDLDVTIYKGVAYIFGANQLHILDLKDQIFAEEIDSSVAVSDAENVVAYANTVYITTYGDNGLEIQDVTNPLSPKYVGSYQIRAASDVAISNSVAYVVDDTGDMYLVDISNLSEPREISVFHSEMSYSSLEDIVIVDTVAYIADGGGGLHLVDITNPSVPIELSFYDTLGTAEEVAIAGNVIFVTDGGSHLFLQQGGYILRAVDITNLQFPVEAGWSSSLATNSDIRASKNIAHILSNYSLYFIEASDPTALKYINNGFFDPFMSNYELDMAMSGDIAYIVSNGGMQVVDVTNPSNPVKLSLLEEESLGVEVANNIAFVSFYDGLRVLDVSDSTNPVEIGLFETPAQGRIGSPSDITLAGSNIYLCDSRGIFIINVDNPQKPEQIGFFDIDTTFQVESIAASENELYIASARSGLRVIDVTNPTNPVEVGYFDTPDFAADVAVAGDVVFVADGEGGLQILHYEGGTLEPYYTKETMVPDFVDEETTATETISIDETSVTEVPSSDWQDAASASPVSPINEVPTADVPSLVKGTDWLIAIVSTLAGLIVIAGGWVLVRRHMGSASKSVDINSKICPYCKTENPKRGRYCKQCGQHFIDI